MSDSCLGNMQSMVYAYVYMYIYLLDFVACFLGIVGSRVQRIFVGGLYTSAMSRRSDEAKPKDLLKIVRGNFNGVDSNDVLLSTESFVEKYGEFLEEVLAVTPRPTATLLKGAIHLAYPGVSGEEVTALANKVNEIYKTTFSRARNLKTGERLTPL